VGGRYKARKCHVTYESTALQYLTGSTYTLQKFDFSLIAVAYITVDAALAREFENMYFALKMKDKKVHATYAIKILKDNSY
jgi:hypothetical protein